MAHSSTTTTSIVQDTSLTVQGEWTFQVDSTITPDDSTFHTSTNAGDQAFLDFNGSYISHQLPAVARHPSLILAFLVSRSAQVLLSQYLVTGTLSLDIIP